MIEGFVLDMSHLDIHVFLFFCKWHSRNSQLNVFCILRTVSRDLRNEEAFSGDTSIILVALAWPVLCMWYQLWFGAFIDSMIPLIYEFFHAPGLYFLPSFFSRFWPLTVVDTHLYLSGYGQHGADLVHVVFRTCCQMHRPTQSLDAFVMSINFWTFYPVISYLKKLGQLA